MDRLAQLEAQAAALQAEIAALKAGAPVKPAAPPERRGVEIRQSITERSDGPSYEELKRLLKVVQPMVPGADKVNKYDPDTLLRGFASCFRRVSNLGRIPAPNPKYAISWWVDETKTWLRARNVVTTDVGGVAFVAAVIASGDIAYQMPDPTRGALFECALVPYGGKPAVGDAWRKVLAGNVLPPVHSARAQVEHAPVRVLGF
jgi:hypothetical protein